MLKYPGKGAKHSYPVQEAAVEMYESTCTSQSGPGNLNGKRVQLLALFWAGRMTWGASCRWLSGLLCALHKACEGARCQAMATTNLAWSHLRSARSDQMGRSAEKGQADLLLQFDLLCPPGYRLAPPIP